MTMLLVERIILDGNIRHEVGDVSSLAANIDRVGVLQPLLVAKRGDDYVLIDGHRRLAAAKQLGEQEVPVHVTTFMEDDAARITMQYSTNVERVDLSAYEKMQATMDLKAEGYNQGDIATELGLSKGDVSKQQKVVKTINDLPNVAGADKLTEQALFDLADLATEHDADALVVENALRAIIDGDARSVDQAFGSAEREAKAAQTMAALEPLLEEISKLGGTFYSQQSDLPRGSESIAVHGDDSTYNRGQMALDEEQVKAHRKLECHGYRMQSGGWSPTQLVEYCTKPRTHAEKGRSEIKEKNAEEKLEAKEIASAQRKKDKTDRQQRLDEAAAMLGGKWSQSEAIGLLPAVVNLTWDQDQKLAKALSLEPIASKFGNGRDHPTEVKTWIASLPKTKQPLAFVYLAAAASHINGYLVNESIKELMKK